MKKIALFLSILMIIVLFPRNISAADEVLELYARAAVLIDGESRRILYGKNENQVLAMASTTKIMTLMIALEYGEMDEEVVFSSYASKEPDVQLNALKGEKYTLKDLLYLMMLRSYNDVAMAVAEHIGGKLNNDTTPNETIEQSKEDVARFIEEMNEKAKSLGCVNTYFLTPNGLDAQDENGKHSTTAYELAIIAAEAIKNPDVVKICGTKSYNYRELSGKRSGTVTNADRYLDMQKGALGLKTGFTGDAGYCFVGAVNQDDRTYISVVLGSGWPPNKNYKWTDTKKLINYGLQNFYYRDVINKNEHYKTIPVKNGMQDMVGTYIPFGVTFLLSEKDDVEVIYKINEYVTAPVKKNEEVGEVLIYVNGKLERKVPVLTTDSVKNKTFTYYFRKLFSVFAL